MDVSLSTLLSIPTGGPVQEPLPEVEKSYFQIFQERIHFSRLAREAKLAGLGEHERHKIEHICERLKGLKVITWDYCVTTVQMMNAVQNPVQEQPIQEEGGLPLAELSHRKELLKVQLEAGIQEFQKDHPEPTSKAMEEAEFVDMPRYYTQREDRQVTVGDRYVLDNLPAHKIGWLTYWEFLCEQIINTYVNRFCYLVQVRQCLQARTREIKQHFCNLPFKLVLHLIEPVNQETHNQGKVPCRITWRYGLSTFRTFYKPRGAQLDQLVIALFTQINQLSSVHKSSRTHLPTYAILSFDSYSIWEFVDGIHQETPVSQYIKGLPEPRTREKEKLRRKLMRLESMCGELGISDLHWQNILYSGGGRKTKIVPIDLENMQPGQPTGLYRGEMDTIGPLSVTEHGLINTCKGRIEGENIPIRAVILPTSALNVALTSPNSLDSIAQAVHNSILEKTQVMQVGLQTLKELVLSDFLNGDIPYWIKKNEGIFHLGQLFSPPPHIGELDQ